ncbi:MAG TPA: CHAT domain-containing protein [Thiotrichaceae bacterium]|nr:CHAT domain-containing protein [Thiotrichaceae bacterium]
MTTLTIREQSNITKNKYRATVTFNKDEFPCTVKNPCTNKQVYDLEWYFKVYPNAVDDEEDDENKQKAKSVAATIKKCGTQLFDQVFCNRSLMRRYDQEKNTGIQYIEIIGSPAFHTLPWETLHDPDDLQPLALNMPIVRQYTSATKVLNVRPSPIINLLIVTARPRREKDIDYRAISRPLVESLRQAKLRVNITILRPCTYRALKNHLSEHQNGYYHIIHLDVHGALQGDKSVVYLESAEADHDADSIEATQLAQLLVQHQIPITILNTCESGKQVGLTETSLSGKFMEAGVPLVLAMRYTVTLGAATYFMKTLYQHLFGEGESHHQSIPDMATAIRYARKTLYNNKERCNIHHEQIELEEWIIPVVYQNTPIALPLRDFKPDEQTQRDTYDARIFHQNPAPPDQFIGRDLDILGIETQIAQRNSLLIRGGTGIGKTTLLHHLAWWWQNTYAVDKVFYFGYDEKLWTHQQVLQTIAQALFVAEGSQGTVVNRLMKERHLLIFDALECLNPSEQTALHDFLMRLYKCKSLILLGSQHNVKGLAKGTFGDNVYELAGIDNTSANILMKSTLKRHHISDNDYNIRILYSQLGKNPLLLEMATRAILENKTALLSALQTAMTETDKQGEAKQRHILQAAINTIYNTLSLEEQNLLLCLAPLKFAINTNTLPEYSQRLQQHAVLADLPFNDWETILEKVADWGLVRLYPEMLLQSAFHDFLLSRLSEKAAWQNAIETTMTQYYDNASKIDTVTHEMSNQNDVQTPNEGRYTAANLNVINRLI